MRKVAGMNRLVVRPRPKGGESCTGYLIRVTEANAYPSLGFILGNSNANVGGYVKSGMERETRQQWRVLEVALGLPEGEIQRRWPRQASRLDMWTPAPVGSMHLVQVDLASAILHICPDCVSEDGYCQSLWELRYYTVCHRHRRLMVSHCGACGDPLSPRRAALLRCGSCNADLEAVCKPIPGHPVAWAIADLLAKGAVGQKVSQAGYEEVDFPWHLVEDPFVVVEAIRMMGWMIKMQKWQWLTASLSAKDRQSQLVKCMEVFEQWPKRWHCLLERKITERAKVISTSRLRLLHHERGMLAMDSVRLRFMQQTLAGWLSEKHPAIWTLKAYKPLASRWQRGAGLMSSGEAARVLRCTDAAIRWKANKGLLIGAPDVKGGSRFMVTKESVDKARAAMGTTVTWNMARRVLKCHSHLIYNEWFRKTLHAEQISNCGHLSIPKERIRWLFDEISKARAKRDIRAEVIRMRQAVSMVMKVGGSYPWILRQILEGNLPVANFHRRRGIRGVRFYKRDVVALKIALMRRDPLDGAILKEADRKARAWSETGAPAFPRVVGN